MRNLNYNHLYYFWVVAKEGSITKASTILYLTPQTISGQLRVLEEAIGGKLFSKSGRNLVLTNFGHTLFQYANDIFKLGSELMDVINGRSASGQQLFRVGISDHIPKPVARRILEAALNLEQPVRIVCHEGKLDDLIANLSIHKLDLVIAESPASPNLNVRVYNHFLGESGVSFFAAPNLLEGMNEDFPKLLDGAPILVPTGDSALRRSLEQWFESEEVNPYIAGEFDDGALLMSFGQAGAGIFVSLDVIKDEVKRQYQVEEIGATTKLTDSFYAITAERKLKNPASIAITDGAQTSLFSTVK